MRQVEIDDATYDRLVVAARLMDRTVGEVVARLVDRLASDAAPSVPVPNQAATAVSKSSTYTPPARATTDPTVEWIPVYKVYKAHRIDGTFNPRNHEVRLSTEPWVNKTFSSPTAAAVAVVEHVSGDVRESPNTNGRKFWKVADTGKNLHSIIGER
ncbi:hypothetical protein HN031_07435 [Nocardioides sp. zg-1308]|uniref:hypothetical protein n=1 Tax=Nocardioides sp. zg-1308 TaxID=2736253 RepID=UPI0015535B3C|nr:hypothetical protein [Nocardioides sp. zg-1308]NPD04515.1 hypothetical protein [Nocardioides sp. zg-1308]